VPAYGRLIHAGGAAMRRFGLASILAFCLLVLTALSVLADSTGPGV